MFRETFFIVCTILLQACCANEVKSSNCSLPKLNSDNHYWLDKPRKDYNGVKTKVPPLPFQWPFHRDVEAEINKQINLELFAHYNYLSMAYHFDRDDINMPGFQKFFLKMAEKEHERAQMLMKYQNKRGGRIRLHSIKEPCSNGIWGNGTQAMISALHLEKSINDALRWLHEAGSKRNDPQFLDFLESNFLGEQVESIKQLSDYVNVLKRLNSILGEYQFDKMTLLKKDQ